MKFHFSDALHDLFRDFHVMTGGINISVFETPVYFSQNDMSLNYGNCVAYPQVEMGNIFCKVIRHSSTVDKRCLLCDAYHADLCKESHKPAIYRCHLGLLEAQIPISVVGDNAAILFIGQIRDVPADKAVSAFEDVWQYLHTIDPAFFPEPKTAPDTYRYYLSYYRSLHTMTPAQFEAWCSFLYTISRDWQSRGFIQVYDETPLEAIHAYIKQHISEPIHAEDICQTLHISRASLYRILQKETGLGFNSYVNLIKLERSRHLLEHYSQIGEVASLLGYDNVSYFTRLFHNHYGTTPTEYRKGKTAGSSLYPPPEENIK